MLPNQVWKSRETKSYTMKIMHMNPNGTVKVTFDFGLNPKTTHNYTIDYLNQFYEYAGYDSVWINDWQPRIVQQPVVVEQPKTELDKAFEALDPEKVLFGDYTGEKKVNTWKEIK